jgi:hypothetical protein
MALGGVDFLLRQPLVAKTLAVFIYEWDGHINGWRMWLWPRDPDSGISESSIVEWMRIKHMFN